MNIKKLNKGFTLIEVLISIVIIGIMSAVTIVSYKGYLRKSNESATKQEISQLAQAFEVAAIENKIDTARASYTYDELKEAYLEATGYALPYTSEELTYSNSVLTLVRRNVIARYSFINKNVSIQ